MKRLKIKSSKLFTSLLFVFLIATSFSIPRKAEAIFPVNDLMAIAANQTGWIRDSLFWIADHAYDIEEAIKKRIGSISYQTIIGNAVNKIAYDTATYLASGDEGKKPMFVTEGWDAYMQNIGENAAGEFIENFSDGLFGDFNLCEPDFNIKVLLGLGLVPQTRPKDSECTFSKIKQNWEKEIAENENFLSDFQNYFSTGGDLGLAISINDQKQADTEDAVNIGNLDALINKGYSAYKSKISNKVQQPADQVPAKTNAIRDLLNSKLMMQTTDIFVDAAKVFANQYALTLFERKLREMTARDTTSPYKGNYGGLKDKDSETATEEGVSTSEAIRQDLLELVRPNFKEVTDFSVLTKLTMCPDPASAGPTDCVIENNFSAAISNNMTVGQAIDDGYLRPDGRFGFLVESIDGEYKCYGEEPNYQEGYPYRSMLILRKYRILPVGWELAAQYIHDNPSVTGSCNLGDMVACYDLFDDYKYKSETCNQDSWCRNLVDPNWVLTIPQHTCKREGPGPDILYYQNSGSADGFGGDLIIKRADYCADEQSCIYEKTDGVCEQYGYCVEEKRKWNFGTDNCDPNFNSCETFRGKSGKSSSFMKNTLDNATCTPDNVGCTAYCEDYSLDTSSVPMFTLEQDGNTHFLPATFSTAQNATTFYNYTAASFNQPALYPLLEQDKSVLFVHYDTNNGIFSLGIFHDYPNNILYPSCETLPGCTTLSPNCDCDGGSVSFTFDYISPDNSVAVEDDPGEGLAVGSEVTSGYTWNWGWGSCCTDGGMIDMPDDNWSVTINPNSSFVGINQWVMAYDGGEINLNPSLPVTISKNVMNGNFECLAGSGDDLYLDQEVEKCDDDSEGCHEFIRTKTDLGTNLIQNSGFEDNVISNTVSVGASATNMIGDSRIAWSVYGGTSGTTVSVYGSSAGRVHSGSKSILIESDSAGVYSYNVDNAGAPSVFPANFEMEINKAYTLSAWVWVESGEVEMGVGNNTVSWQTVNSTTTGQWERLVLTVVNEPSLSADEFYIYGNAVGTRFWLDDVQFEAGLNTTGYKGYRGRNIVYEKILPSYLEDECYRIPGTDYRFKNSYSPICDDYARLCNQDEVGCELYTSVNTDVSIPANVDVLDYCAEECVGYDEYLQLESQFSSLSPKYFIPANADSCDAGSVGCEEFTNLDAVGGGGEQKEYYSYLRQCVKPSDTGADCREFYTWEGSSETGFQLKVHSLQADVDTDDGSYPNPEARYTGDPAVTSYDYDECNYLVYQLNLNSDCREFYNRSGQVSYHLYSRTLTCSDNCHPFRMTKNNVAKDPVTGANISWGACQGLSNFSDYRDIITNSEFIARGGECVFCINGGVWSEGMDSCVYKAIPEQGSVCSATANGCREYSGSDGNLVYNVLNDNFEGDVQSWVGVGATTVITDNDSLRINEEALRVQNSPFTIAKEVGTKVTQGKSYYLEFIAKNISASQFNSIYLTNGTDVAEFYTNPSMSLSISGDYALYKLNLSILGHEVSDIESLVIEADGGFLIDDIKLIEITDRYYSIEDSWTTPDSCFEDVYGNPVGQLYNLGCDAYRDRSDSIHYLHNFPVLCQESAVGCEAMIDTSNYTPYYEDTFNPGDPSEEVVAADTLVYAVYDKEKECESDYKGCQLLGEPYDYGNFSLYKQVYLVNNPDMYSRILCRDDEKGCEEWSSREGSSYFKDPGDQTCEYRLESNSGKLRGTCFSGSDCEDGYDCVNNVCTKKTRDWNWYKTQVKRCDVDSNGVVGIVDNICLGPSDCGSSGLTCSSDADCGNFDVCLSGICRYSCIKDVNDYLCPTTPRATIGTGGDGSRVYTPTTDADYNNWVGICPTSEASCTEYIDPISNFSVNLLSNGGFSNLPSVVYNNEWYCSIGGDACWSLPVPARECDNSGRTPTTDDDGICEDNIWKRNGTTYTQTVQLEKDNLYRLAGRNDTVASQLSIECPSLMQFDPLENNFSITGSSIDIDLTNVGVMYSEMFYVQNKMKCIITMNNVATGAGDYVELKKVLVEYQLEDGLDKTTCNGIANPNEGCVLFNERGVEHKSLSNITYSNLPYSADATLIGAPTNCGGVNCNVNQILKVEPDRACNKWLACTNMIEAGNGEEAVCAGIGICDKLDRNGNCDRFVPIMDGNYIYNPSISGVYNAGDIHNMSGYVKVGYQGTKINEDTTGKSDDKLNFGSMTAYGGQAEIQNGSFEFSHENLCNTPATPALCPSGTDWPRSDEDLSIKASDDYGDDDYPFNWECVAPRNTNCEIIDDTAENQDEGDCFEEDRDGTCKLYAPDGGKYMKLSADNDGPSVLTSEKISVDINTNYVLSFYISTRALNNGRAEITIIEKDEDGNITNSSLRKVINYRLPWQRALLLFRTGANAYSLNIQITEIAQPQGAIYVDDFRLEETLQVRSAGGVSEDAYEAKECRLYPEDDSLACDYYKDGVRYKGWSGYCLEHDRYPGWNSACLQWWSIPHSVDSVNAWCGDEVVGDEEDCECDRDVNGDEVYSCDSRVNIFGTSKENSYRCENCMWASGWCGDNYIDLTVRQGRAEECDWNDKASLFPWGSDPLDGGITCENLPAAYQSTFLNRSDLAGYAGDMFTDGNLGCFSHDLGANYSGNDNDRCYFDTTYGAGNFTILDPTSDPVDDPYLIGFGCTSQLSDMDYTDGANNAHTAQQCIALNSNPSVASAEVVSEDLGGIVVIDSTGETISTAPDFGKTFCKITLNSPIAAGNSYSYDLACNSISPGWRNFNNWSATQTCYDYDNCPSWTGFLSGDFSALVTTLNPFVMVGADIIGLLSTADLYVVQDGHTWSSAPFNHDSADKCCTFDLFGCLREIDVSCGGDIYEIGCY